ncbi:restriction endonuclease subunit S [Erythrobacter sp. HL-111]|uniref:restriction endonuclease subunit S n=1 Tax=Erythrobacter sp. HL-111 TaxID=1798193 RepID=UPI00087A3566|nr:restriction endonuclease subunit S [Erythrobacter sp. HL-111]SDS99183.1 type I restriction enzyme, S subunit [Erythrobacter sp. HL-111]
MNAERLLALYEKVAEAPDAVPRLRRFVLDLAVRGKLVPQEAGDEPASELLKRIAAEKARLVKAGEIRKKAAQNPKMVEPPHELPSNWRWVSLGTVFLYDAGAKREPKSLDPSLWLLELEDIEKETGRLVARISVADRESKSTKSEFQVGDILYGKLRPYLTKVLVADAPGYSTTEIVAIRPFLPLCSEYCALALKRPAFVDYVTRLGQGTKMPRLRTEDAVVSPFPLPPLAEQRRIVAKVEELMALLDRLEAARTAREATRDRLTAASLARLTAHDTDAADFPAHARFALAALPALTTRPDQIKPLRQTILNLAVRGKLVEQDPTEEPIKLPQSGDGDGPEALPSGWRFARLGHLLAENTRNGFSRRPDDAENGVPILRISAGTVRQDGIVAEEEHKLISGIDDATRFQYGLQRGDLLACRFNGNKAFVGRLTLFNDYLRLDPIYPDKLIRIRLDRRLALPEFIRMAGESDLVRGCIEVFCATTVGNWGVSASNLKEVPFPLPPLAEQHRIVAKVDALMALCDRLEATLTTTDTTRARLLEALLHEALTSAEEREAAA